MTYVRCKDMDYTVLLERVDRLMGNCFLESFGRGYMWIKRVLAKITVNEVFEAMRLFLDVVPYRIRRLVLKDSH